jgi:hypothetical protein
MARDPRLVQLDDDDWCLYHRPDGKWEIYYRPYDIPQGPLFDSEAEAYEFYYAHRAELKAYGMKSSGK